MAEGVTHGDGLDEVASSPVPDVADVSGPRGRREAVSRARALGLLEG